ncbi:U-box domain-containing protein kinase family protein isoform 1 [Hibiscus syriacus]|uniref:U-box domain-containing protein kinase family protein isoform 1 n=1 Tax=Hibiscus syriacus TaxID=106335 RepID=A0A6A3CFJ6_HIBSY|nr:epsin-3-like [Hibiscus syriacus]KAE8728003.1 U-box domain-containing protein kinase family protein isoform 1 [Hibiscus syriacus]
MSTLSKNPSNMGYPFFHEFKKQASFFLKEKIKTARLALTDVTPAQLLTEEATNGNTWAPNTQTLGSISRAAFELDDYRRIVEILHQKLGNFERKTWRTSYNSLIVLEHLLTHGPESTAEEFQADQDSILKMQSFQYIDEKGFNWGLAVRKKSERVLKLLEKGPVLKEERNRARKLTRGIKGFGSFSQRSSSSSTQGILQESSSHLTYGRSNSDFIDHENQENQLPVTDKVDKTEWWNNETAPHEAETSSFKENMGPLKEEVHNWTESGECNPLLGSGSDEPRPGVSIEDDHPFSSNENGASCSMLLSRDGILQGC